MQIHGPYQHLLIQNVHRWKPGLGSASPLTLSPTSATPLAALAHCLETRFSATPQTCQAPFCLWYFAFFPQIISWLFPSLFSHLCPHVKRNISKDFPNYPIKMLIATSFPTSTPPSLLLRLIFYFAFTIWYIFSNLFNYFLLSIFSQLEYKFNEGKGFDFFVHY